MKLIYFTASFPYGLGETWKSNELKYFKKYFNEIVIIPYSYNGNFTQPKALAEGVKCEQPLFQQGSPPVYAKSIFRLLDKKIFFYLKEFFQKKVYLNKRWLLDWLYSSIEIKELLKHPVIVDLIKNPDKNTILYFFWGRGSAAIIPFLDKNKYSKIVVRFHRYDLFEYENNGYIPYRKALLKGLSMAAPSSDIGKAYIRSTYPDAQFNMETFRIGTISEGKANRSQDGILRIVSCSYLVAVKRVHLIVQALLTMDILIEWTHIGDGELRREIESLVKNLPPNIKVNFTGMIESTKVIGLYKSMPVDLFINVSSSEGVPFSIMEAFSAAIPVFATDVGGTREVVDDSVGKLLSHNITPDILAQELKIFHNLSSLEKDQMKDRAFLRYEERCNAEIIATEFAKYLIQ